MWVKKEANMLLFIYFILLILYLDLMLFSAKLIDK
jgi:hypothetical protein